MFWIKRNVSFVGFLILFVCCSHSTIFCLNNTLRIVLVGAFSPSLSLLRSSSRYNKKSPNYYNNKLPGKHIHPTASTVIDNNNNCKYNKNKSNCSNSIGRQTLLSLFSSVSNILEENNNNNNMTAERNDENHTEKCGAVSSDDEDSLFLTKLCQISIEACDIMTPLIRAIYISIMEDEALSTGIKTLKKDNSAFTIADGTVQYLLEQYLFGKNDKLSWLEGIVGEEESENIHLPYDDNNGNNDNSCCEPPYRVDSLEIPSKFNALVEKACISMKQLQTKLPTSSSLTNNHKNKHGKLTIFIDPIDGTREFSSGKKGDQCSICIGFASQDGNPVAGVVYRPLTNNLLKDNDKYMSTWAAGAKSENYLNTSNLLSSSLPKGEEDNNFDAKDEGNSGYLVTSNGSISPFLTNLMKELNYQRYPSGGAGNKMLLLLEQQQRDKNDNDNNIAYILDRGVSRWDTCAAQAVLEAQGGILVKLDSFLSSSEDGEFHEESYTYQITDTNLDMPQYYTANLTKYNVRNNNIDDKTTGSVTDSMMVKPYSNICGMLALPKEGNTFENKKRLLKAMKSVCAESPPSFD